MRRHLYIILISFFAISVKCNAQADTAKSIAIHKITFQLNGRQIIEYPPIVTDTDKKGIVVVEITVDSNGDVMKAKPGVAGTTATSAILLAKARQAALKTKFNKNASINEQVGTITIAIDRKP